MTSDIFRLAQSGDIQFFKQHCACLSSKSSLLEKSHQKSGDTVIHVVARHGHAELLDFLLDTGFPIDPGNFDGKRPLHEAAQNGKLLCVKLLLNKKAAVDSLKRSDW